MAFLLLVACSGVRCPEGYVAARVEGVPACVGAASYCTQDEQCTSAQFDCARPCVPVAVNSLFALDAKDAAARCNREGIRCKQVPYVEHVCAKSQCVAIPHTADELVPLPVFEEVEEGKQACYAVSGGDALVRLHVLNAASLNLNQVEALFNVSLKNGSSVMVSANLLNESIRPNESRRVEQKIINATPREVYLFAVRPVAAKGITLGVRNADTVAHLNVTECGNSVGNA